jgi:hypothetical protein
MSEFERIITDSLKWEDLVNGWDEVNMEECDYELGCDDGPDYVEYETDADWDVYGEEEFA